MDGVVLDADANAVCDIPARLYDEGIALVLPHGDVRALFEERTGTKVGMQAPDSSYRALQQHPHQPKAKGLISDS